MRLLSELRGPRRQLVLDWGRVVPHPVLQPGLVLVVLHLRRRALQVPGLLLQRVKLSLWSRLHVGSIVWLLLLGARNRAGSLAIAPLSEPGMVQNGVGTGVRCDSWSVARWWLVRLLSSPLGWGSRNPRLLEAGRW